MDPATSRVRSHSAFGLSTDSISADLSSARCPALLFYEIKRAVVARSDEFLTNIAAHRAAPPGVGTQDPLSRLEGVVAHGNAAVFLP